MSHRSKCSCYTFLAGIHIHMQLPFVSIRYFQWDFLSASEPEPMQWNIGSTSVNVVMSSHDVACPF